MDEYKLKEFSQNYLNVLRGTFAGLNLVGIESDEEFHIKQVLDAVLPLKDSQLELSIQKSQLVVDIGFGGGFPLLPLAYSYPTIPFLGFEARGKKVKAVKEIARQLDIHNVKPYHQRLESICFDRSAVVTFKAVGECRSFLEKIWAIVPLTVYFYKGPQVFQLEEASWKGMTDWILIEKLFYPLPGTDGRWLLGFKNQKWKSHSKGSLVNLSSFL